jgi:EAL domain-containing protein (putative c-di-GMP-specific phosphodiesterase class I)
MPPKNRTKPTGNPLGFVIADRDSQALELVREGLRENKTMLAYQPVVIASAPEQPAFYEGLIRIMDKTGRIVPAADFIDAAEMTELGRQIDCAALTLGFAALQRVPDLRLSINMSARSISYAPWKRILRDGIRNDPTVGERLILEVTERSAMVIPDAVRSFMSALQKHGVSFALDDFGAGYTSFRHLRDFSFDILKIDGSLIKNIHKNPDSQVLAGALVSLAQHFEMYTVAEHVESEADVDILIAAGIDCLQGYYFGVPTVRPLWLQDAEPKKTA